MRYVIYNRNGYTRNFASPGKQMAVAFVPPVSNSAALANNVITSGNTLITGAGRMARDVLPVGGAIGGAIPGAVLGLLGGGATALGLGADDPLTHFLALGGGATAGLLGGGAIGNKIGRFLSNRYFPENVPAQPVVAK
jgi:hypothetical protein